MNRWKICPVFCLFLALSIIKSRADLSDVTGYLLEDINEGELAAFGDFSSDKTTDLFVITKSGERCRSCVCVQFAVQFAVHFAVHFDCHD
jgi:hypothetical protein